MLYDDNKIEKIEYTIYNTWFNSFIDMFSDYEIIYVTTPPDICSHRITTRGRKGEEIPLEYLNKCDMYHKEWINNDNKKPYCVGHDFDENVVGDIVKFIESIV